MNQVMDCYEAVNMFCLTLRESANGKLLVWGVYWFGFRLNPRKWKGPLGFLGPVPWFESQTTFYAPNHEKITVKVDCKNCVSFKTQNENTIRIQNPPFMYRCRNNIHKSSQDPSWDICCKGTLTLIVFQGKIAPCEGFFLEVEHQKFHRKSRHNTRGFLWVWLDPTFG